MITRVTIRRFVDVITAVPRTVVDFPTMITISQHLTFGSPSLKLGNLTVPDWRMQEM